MTPYERLIVELISHAKGIHDPKIESNLAVDQTGELIEVVNITGVVHKSAEFINVTIGVSKDFE